MLSYDGSDMDIWILSTMGMRDINIIYQKLLPRASNYIIGLHICTTGIVRMQIDGLTHVEVL